MINTIKADLFFRIGQNKAEKGYFEESVSFFNRAIGLSRNPAGVFIQKALSLSSLKKYEDAINSLKKAINLEPGNPSNYLFLGIIHYDNQRPDEAIECFDKVLELSPDNSYAECYTYLTRLLKNQTDLESLEDLSKKIKFANAEFKARYLVYCETFLYHHRQTSMTFEAGQFHETYLDPDNKKMMSDVDRASTHTESLIRKIMQLFKPAYYRLFNQLQLAINCLSTGEVDKAQEEIQSILDKEPQFEEALEVFTDICLYKNEIDLAIKYLKNIDAYSETLEIIEQEDYSENDRGINFLAALDLGILLTLKGDYEKAIALLKLGVSDSDKNYYPFYCLGRSYLYAKEKEEAFRYFKLSMSRLHPGFLEKRLAEHKRILAGI